MDAVSLWAVCHDCKQYGLVEEKEQLTNWRIAHFGHRSVCFGKSALPSNMKDYEEVQIPSDVDQDEKELMLDKVRPNLELPELDEDEAKATKEDY